MIYSDKGRIPYFFGQAGCRRSKAEANAPLAVKCCFENNRRPEIINWRDCRIVAAKQKFEMHPQVLEVLDIYTFAVIQVFAS